jgi:carboxylesterase type B
MHSVFQCLALLLIGMSAVATGVIIQIDTATPAFAIEGVQDDDVNFFYDIPFSKPRVPPHRFALPEEYVHVEGEIYDATVQHHDNQCVQNNGQGKEDCLYLDVYMPLGQTKVPVMVWIHGGSWMSGSKNEYGLKFWAKHEWVAGAGKFVGVAVNYRLNVLGYPDLAGVSHNLAMHDNMAALEWVQKHISNFEGDPDLVTIFGESAGSMQTQQLWASQNAQHLFARAISQSPYVWSYETGQATPYKTREAKQNNMASCFGCAPGDSGCDYQTPTIENLVNASCFGPWYGPVGDDGATISNHYHQDICMQQNSGGKPLLVGHNSLEINLWSFMGSQGIKKNQMLEWIKHFAPEVDNMCFYNELGHEYELTGLMQDPAVSSAVLNPPAWMTWMQLPEDRKASGTREEARDLYATSGVFFNMISINLMKLPNVYYYVFNETAVHNPMFPMCHDPAGAHACEIPFVLQEPAKFNASSELGTGNLQGGEDLDTAIQTTMRGVWGNFVLYGLPGWEGDEVGVFTDGGHLEYRAAFFDPKINLMLEQLMCAPETISEPCGSGKGEAYECGEIKHLYKENGCCGMPTKIFELPSRRLSAVPAIAKPNEPSRILRSMDLALQDAKLKGGATRARRLAKLMGEVLADY